MESHGDYSPDKKQCSSRQSRPYLSYPFSFGHIELMPAEHIHLLTRPRMFDHRDHGM